MAEVFGERQSLRPLELIASLEAHRVDYVLIGGIAALSHGVQRTTQDIDLVIDPGPENCSRMLRVLLDAKAQIILGRDRRVPLDANADPAWLAADERFFDTALGGIDLRKSEKIGAAPYGELRSRALRAELPSGGAATISSREDLIAMKRFAGRDQDLDDIRALGEVERLEQEARE